MAEFTYPYERAAMLGEEMPDGLNIVDQFTFLCLRNLYAQKRSGVIDRETGSREKARLGYERGVWERKLLIRERVVQHSVKMLKAVELAACAYAKDRTLENADQLYWAIYGMNPGKGAPPP